MNRDGAVRYNRNRNFSREKLDQMSSRIGHREVPSPTIQWTEALARWQAEMGLEVDGMAGPTTQAALLGSGDGLLPPLLHPLPPLIERWGYDHLQPFPEKAPVWLEIVSGESWLSGMLRLLTSTDHNRGTCSRSPGSVISLDTISFGIAHWWAGTCGRLFQRLAETAPALCDEAWGEAFTKAILAPSWAEENLGRGRGWVSLSARLYGLAGGFKWAAMNSRHRYAMARVQCDLWAETYVPKGRRLAESLGGLDGPDGGKILAACVRLCNSGAAWRRVRAAQERAKSSDPMAVLENCYTTSREGGGYGKPDRWERINTDAAFSGPAPPSVEASRDLTWRLPCFDRLEGGDRA